MNRQLWIVALAALAAASTARADAIDEYVRSTMARERTPGLVLGIATGTEGSRVRSYNAVRTYGLANLEHQVAVRPNTIFQSGSTGKQFTAAAVLLMAEDGKLALDDSIARYFPADRPSWRATTVRHLLTHTSGLPDYDGDGTGVKLDLRRDYTEEELVRWASQLEPQFAPGTRWAYSNTGYVVLGALIRKVSGKFYGEVLRERIFSRADMSTARVISEADIVSNRAAGYELVDGSVRNQSWVSPVLNTTADGSLYLTVRDLLAWDTALRERRLLDRSSYEAMWQPARLADGTRVPYGFGWFLDEQRGWRNFEHSGSWQGFKAHIARYLDRGLSIVVLCNLSACSASKIAHTVAGLIDPALRLPDPEQSGMDPEPQRTRTLRAVLEAWARGEVHQGMSPLYVAHLQSGEQAASERRVVAEQLAQENVFRYLAEDDVQTGGLERGGGKVFRIVYCSSAGPRATKAYRFYLDERGAVLDLDVEY